jgi:spermidine synthase
VSDAFTVQNATEHSLRTQAAISGVLGKKGNWSIHPMIRRRFIASGVLAVLVACLIAQAEDKVLYEKPSAFSQIIVTENAKGMRTLLFEKGGARQSVVKLGDPDHLELPYSRVMSVGLAIVERPERVLIIGLGGGTIPSFLHKHYPKTRIDVVDIDPDVVDVARRYFEFREDDCLRAHVDDGRRFIEQCREPYDIIYLDAFSADSVPYHLATQEFLEAVRKAVKPDGVVLGNIWSRDSNRLYDAMVRTYQEVFDDLYVFDVQGAGNKILAALPSKQLLNRENLARRAKRVSRENGFRFDLAELVLAGYQHPRKEDFPVAVLTDKDPPKKTE